MNVDLKSINSIVRYKVLTQKYIKMCKNIWTISCTHMHRNSYSYTKVIKYKIPQAKRTFRSTYVLEVNKDVLFTICLTFMFINMQ